MLLYLFLLVTLTATFFIAKYKAYDDYLVITSGNKVSHLFWAIVRGFFSLIWASCWYWLFSNAYEGLILIIILINSFWWIVFDLCINKNLGKGYTFIGTTAWFDKIFRGNWYLQMIIKTILFLFILGFILFIK